MRFHTRLLTALSIGAWTLSNFTLVYAATDDMDVLNYIADQQKQERELQQDTPLNRFRKEIKEEYAKEHLVPSDNPKEAPFLFTGDTITYNSVNGDTEGRGDVNITYNYSRLSTQEATGNIQTGQVDLPSDNILLQLEKPVVQVQSARANYNYHTKTGVMYDVEGQIDRKYIRGREIQFFPDYIEIHDGLITKIPGKKPDYALVADKILIYPDKEIKAYNAKLQIKGHTIYKVKEYATGIGQGGSHKRQFIPIRLNMNKNDGFILRYEEQWPLYKHVYAFANLRAMTKQPMRNVYGVAWENANNRFMIERGRFEDSDDRLLKKDITYIYDYRNRISHTPLSYDFYNEYGKWIQGDIRSWHREHKITVTHDPIKFDPKGKMMLFADIGYRFVKESVDQQDYNSLTYNLTGVKTFSPQWNVFAGYHYSQVSTENSLITYGLPSYSKKISTGFTYSPDIKNRFIVDLGFDANDGMNLRNVKYHWFHDWHSFQTELRYDAKEKNWRLYFDLYEF